MAGDLATLAQAVEELATACEALRADIQKRDRRLRRWIGSTVAGIVAALALIFLLHLQDKSTQERVDEALANSDRNRLVIDATRLPLCAILYPVLAAPLPPGATRQQVETRDALVTVYGPGTPEQPGLNCPRELP